MIQILVGRKKNHLLFELGSHNRNIFEAPEILTTKESNVNCGSYEKSWSVGVSEKGEGGDKSYLPMHGYLEC